MLVAELERVKIGPMSRPRADRTLGLLSRMQTVAASKMYDVTRRVSEADSASDPAEVLPTKARLLRRDSKRMAKVARHLPDMPETREKFAEERINLDQAAPLANAAEKAGHDPVEADLVESAVRDRFTHDVDALILDNQTAVTQAVHEVSRRRGLPPSWLKRAGNRTHVGRRTVGLRTAGSTNAWGFVWFCYGLSQRSDSVVSGELHRRRSLRHGVGRAGPQCSGPEDH